MRTPEGQVKAKLRKWLGARGAYQFWPVQTGLGARGIDCYACIAGKFFAFECKAYRKKATGIQNKILQDVVASGGTALIATVDADGDLFFASPHTRAVVELWSL